MDTSTYRRLFCEALEERYSNVVDKKTGAQYSFRELFYPIRIDEGKYAFLSYRDMMEKPDDTEKTLDLAQLHSVLDNQEEDIYDFGPVLSDNNEAADAMDEIERIIAAGNNQKDSKNLQKQLNIIERQLQEIVGINRENVDYIQDEPEASIRGHVVLSLDRYSRVLALANAGSGKTTLIRRIALFHCAMNTGHYDLEKDFDAYGLEYRTDIPIVPVILPLREVGEKSVDDAILHVVKQYLPGKDHIQEWIDNSEILLLIDGLDELSSQGRVNFIANLEEYLKTHRETRVLMTSRVAGVLGNNILERIRKMSFRGRTIMPLSESETYNYCKQWIRITNNEEYLDFAERIQTEKRYQYLRDFMRTPLELLTILSQMVRGSISHNKWKMFDDMLWEQITNHVSSEQKEAYYEDIITLLSFFALKMQENDSMFLDYEEIEPLLPEMKKLVFQTRQFSNITADSIWSTLNDLAANLGVVEVDQVGNSFTFPIRAYQEFLVSYACCHLPMGSDMSINPIEILEPHINDSNWFDIIIYSILDMEYHNSADVEEFVSVVIDKCNDPAKLKNIIENILGVSIEHALAISKKYFYNITRDVEPLLLAALQSKSASSFLRVIQRLYKKDKRYLRALAYTQIVSGKEITVDDQELLNAEVLILYAGIKLGEVHVSVNAYPEITDADIQRIADLAKSSENIVYVEALTELYVSGLIDHTKIEMYLNADLAAIVIGEIHSFPTKEIVLDRKRNEELKRLFTILGSFPIQKGLFGICKMNVWEELAYRCEYERSLDDFNYDICAFLACGLHSVLSPKQFIYRWIVQVCKGMPSQFRRMTYSRKRERNHFEILKHDLSKWEKNAWPDYLATLNTFKQAENAAHRYSQYLL